MILNKIGVYRDKSSCRVNGNMIHSSSMAFQSGFKLAGVQIPQLNRGVIGGTGQLVEFRMDSNTIDSHPKLQSYRWPVNVNLAGTLGKD